MAYSAGGQKFSNETIIRQYEILLRRIERNELTIGKPSRLIDTLLKGQAHVFRSGTLTTEAKKLHAKRRSKYLKMIDDCKDDVKKMKSKITVARKLRKGKDPDKLIGRRVLVPGEHWGIHGLWYTGVITKWVTWRVNKVRRQGYSVMFNDNKTESWLPEKLIPHLVHGKFCAADIDDYRVVTRDDNVIQLKVHDRVYANFRSTDEWYHGTVVRVITESDVRFYDIRYDDNDYESSVRRDCIVFLDRPPEETLSNEMKMKVDRDKQDAESNGKSIIDLIDVDVVDVELGELTGHTDLTNVVSNK